MLDRFAVSRTLLIAALLLSTLVGMQVAAAQAGTPDAPAALQTEAVAGPWRMTVQEVVTGDDANSRITGASPANLPLPDGLAYVAVRLTATNTGSTPLQIEGGDFSIADVSGIVYGSGGSTAPDPALDGAVEPSASLDGWIVGVARSDAAGLILIYDSVSLTGNWADAAFALTPGAVLTPAAARAMELNRTGRDAGDPAGLATPVATRDWVVELLEIREGADILALFPESDRRTTALESGTPGASATWIGFRVRITNNQTGMEPAFLPPTAFMLADSAGEPNPDLLWLTPPFPDASGGYFPGGSREGWVLFDESNATYTPEIVLLRFLPNWTDDDARYFSLGGSGGGGSSSTPSFTGTLEPGTTVVTTDDLVNLRAEPTTSADVVEEMARGTELNVTGAPVEGDGVTWYPVEDPASGNAGFVAQQFIEPSN